MTIPYDKKFYAVAAAIIGVIACIAMAITARSLRTENAGLKARQTELMALKDEALKLREAVGSVTEKKSVTRVEGVVQAADEIFKSLGISQKVRSVKPSGSGERQYGIEEEAEVQLEKLTMNELVNLLYRVENAPMVLTSKKASMKTAFDNPTLLNVTMVITLIKPK
ncbi:MAG: hypothetical protein HZB33_08180 [Nitrospirae bacterium]|nr:hypothetical protein [Nitrospirota bacterium]